MTTATNQIDLRRVRSILCVPGHELPRRIGRARSSGADLLLLDLEDSAPDVDKSDALGWIVEYAAAADMVRVNHPSTATFQDEIRTLCRQTRVRAIMLPKVESADDLAALFGAWCLYTKEPDDIPSVIVSVESPRAVIALPGILNAGFPIAGVAFGRWDFMACCGISDPMSPLVTHAMALVSLAAKAHNLHVSDAPCYNLDAGDDMQREVERARRLGFDSKGCAHPSQVPYCGSLGPSMADLDRACNILDTGRNGVVRRGNILVGPPMRKLAATILEAV